MKLQLSRSVWIGIAAAVLLLLLLLVVDPDALQVLLSVPLVLFLPGFVLSIILFPHEKLGIPERLLLSAGLSIAFTALSGLILNLTPWGLQASTLWFALLLFLAVEMAVLFVTRRARWREAVASPLNINFNPRQWIFMTLAALMAIMAIQVARSPAPQGGLEGYTILSARAVEASDSILLNVRNEEFKETGYQIKYQVNGTIQRGPTLRLKPGETWEQTVPIPVDELAGKPFTVLLYRLSNPSQVYRHVDWWPETQ